MKSNNRRRLIFIILLISATIIPRIFNLMVISVNIFFTSLFVGVLLEGIDPKTKLLSDDSPLRSKIKDITLKKADTYLRVVFIIIALGIFWFDSLPIYVDTFDLVFNGKSEEINCIVKRSDEGGGITGMQISQGIDVECGDVKNLKIYFRRKKFVIGQKYHFVIMPHSKIVLSEKAIN